MAFVQFSGVTFHDPDLAHGSYVLYTGADGVSRLIDLNGVVRNEWPHPGVSRPESSIQRSTMAASAISAFS
jgi:hypothetical protein